MGTIGVAISGGGHRATLFGLGALMFLADAGRNGDVCSIASVSGGSLTNAYVGQEGNYRAGQWAHKPDFDAVAAALASQIANRGTMWAAWTTKVWVAVAAIALVATFLVFLLPWWWVIRMILWFVAFLVWIAVFWSLRGGVCARAYKKTLYTTSSGNTSLNDLGHTNPTIDHVICATDLHAGEHFDFSGRFVYNYRYGRGARPGMKVQQPVSASTSVPGAFPPRWFRATRFGFQHGAQQPPPRWITVVDGGVYDNMADQWASGLADRKQRTPGLFDDIEDIDELVVVNCSAGMRFESTSKMRVPAVGELLALSRAVSIMYDNSASLRRQSLVGRFIRSAGRIRNNQAPGDFVGSLVSIDQSPFRIPRAFENSSDPGYQQRAQDVLNGMLATENEQQWSQIAQMDSAVATTLRKLGREVSARLIRHAYILAAANLHVLLGYPPPTQQQTSKQRFEALVQ